MDDAVFMGVYAAKQARAGILPGQHESGLWQAWSMPDGNYMIQPLDENRDPAGALSLMESREFMYIFDPMPTELELGYETDDSRFRADAPNLLAQWYMQAVAESPISLEDEDHLPAPSGPMTDENLAFFEDSEPMLTSPEPYFFDNGQGSDAVQLVSRPSSVSLGGSSLLSPIEAYRRFLSNFEPDEVTLRQEFADLIKNLRNGVPDPLTEEKTKLFFEIDLGDIPKQAHLFTEFGLSLRREKQVHLALLAHQRALKTSPGDANILFNLARAWYEMGNFDEAKKLLNEALESAPKFETARNFLHFLQADSESGQA